MARLFLFPHGSANASGRHSPAVSENDLSARIEQLIAPTLLGMGIDTVRVLITGKVEKTLQIMVEPTDGSETTVEHCASASRAISAILDVEDPIDGEFRLEVSSPGLDRPLVKLKDFERFAGFEAKLEMLRPINGQRRYQGRVLRVEDDEIVILADGAETRLKYADVRRSKLILTDDLLATMEGEAVS